MIDVSFMMFFPREFTKLNSKEINEEIALEITNKSTKIFPGTNYRKVDIQSNGEPDIVCLDNNTFIEVTLLNLIDFYRLSGALKSSGGSIDNVAWKQLTEVYTDSDKYEQTIFKTIMKKNKREVIMIMDFYGPREKSDSIIYDTYRDDVELAFRNIYNQYTKDLNNKRIIYCQLTLENNFLIREFLNGECVEAEILSINNSNVPKIVTI